MALESKRLTSTEIKAVFHSFRAKFSGQGDLSDTQRASTHERTKWDFSRQGLMHTYANQPHEFELISCLPIGLLDIRCFAAFSTLGTAS